MLQIGGRIKYNFNKNIAFGYGLEVMYTDKQNYYPFAYGGVYISFLKTSKNFSRKCPSRF
jgi:glycine cleavage system pyridoxal-binding protein P